MAKGLPIRESGIYDRIMSFTSDDESTASFSRRSGIPRETLELWIHKHQKGIGILNIQRFVEAMDVSYDWLITGREGPAIAATQEEARRAVKEVKSSLEHLSGILSRVEVTDAETMVARDRRKAKRTGDQ